MNVLFFITYCFMVSIDAVDFSVYNKSQELVPRQFAITSNQQLALFAGSIVAYQVQSQWRYKHFLSDDNKSDLVWAFLDKQINSEKKEQFYFVPFTHQAIIQVAFSQEELQQKNMQIRSATFSEKQAIQNILQQDDHYKEINSTLWTQALKDRIKRALQDSNIVDAVMFGSCSFEQKPVYVGLWFRMQEYWYRFYYNYLRRG